MDAPAIDTQSHSYDIFYNEDNDIHSGILDYDSFGTTDYDPYRYNDTLADIPDINVYGTSTPMQNVGTGYFENYTNELNPMSASQSNVHGANNADNAVPESTSSIFNELSGVSVQDDAVTRSGEGFISDANQVGNGNNAFVVCNDRADTSTPGKAAQSTVDFSFGSKVNDEGLASSTINANQDRDAFALDSIDYGPSQTQLASTSLDTSNPVPSNSIPEMTDADYPSVMAFLLKEIELCPGGNDRRQLQHEQEVGHAQQIEEGGGGYNEGDERSSINDEEQQAPEPHGYDLRPGNRDAALAQATWLDRDETGNYDPNARPPKRSAGKRRPPRHAISNKSDTESEATAQRRLTRKQNRLYDAACRVNGDSRVFTFQFSSDKSLAVLASTTDNWPSEEWNTLHDPLQDFSSLEQISADDAEDDIRDHSLFKKHKLRNRDQAKASNEGRPNLHGQPAARGCWGCYQLGLLDNGDITNKRDTRVCSLVHNGADWPCQTCLDDGQECELVTPPKVKKSCESCIKRKVNCSYGRVSNHGVPCLECQDTGHHCVAGPNRSAIRHRISLDGSASPEQPDVVCTDCHRANKNCTLKVELERNKGRSCRRCEKKGHECIIADLDTPIFPEPYQVETHKLTRKKRKDIEPMPADEQVSKRPRLPNQHKSAHQSLREVMKAQRAQTEASRHREGHQMTEETIQPQRPKPHRPPRSTQQPGVKSKVITTKLCHPITFNFEDSADGTSCHFCSIQSYQILGLGPSTPTVADTKDEPIREVRNGHAAQGNLPTRICVVCTSRLMQKMTCPSHNIQPLGAKYLVDFCDYIGRFQRMRQGMMRATDLWCSICPSVAEYYCCGSKNGNRPGGCGLLLCDNCNVQLEQGYNGNFYRFLESLPLEATEDRPMGIRADAELMKKDGELVKFMLAMVARANQ